MTGFIKKYVTGFLVALSLFLLISPVKDHEAVDMTRTGSLTLNIQYEGQAINGGTLTIIQVGEIVEENGDFKFKWIDALQDVADIEQLNSPDTAVLVYEKVHELNLTGKTVKVENGQAVFKDLPLGLYLVEQEDKADGFMALGSFLISVPQWEDDHYSYDIVANAKTELTKPKATEPPPPDKPELPNTGQLNWPIPVFTCLGLSFIAVGFILYRKSSHA